MVNWKEIDPAKVVEYCTAYYARYSAYPSVRDIFYHFIDVLWPNTKSVYKALSAWLRDQRLTEKIDWRLIRDGAKREYDEGDWSLTTPREHVEDFLNLFIDIGARYNLPMWQHQPKKVIVACEKEADYPIIQSLTRDLNVDTFYERGYSGWRPLFETAERIESEGKIPVLIVLGDFDPSGEDMVRFLKDAFDKLDVKNLEIEKVAVTKEQIETFKLPHTPEDAQEIAKLRKDSRFKKWPYGLYRVETAALRDRAPDYFDKVIQEAVLKHFNPKIHEIVKKQQEEARDRIAAFFKAQEDLIDELRENIETSEELD